MTFRAPLTPGDEVNFGLAGTGPNDRASGAQLMYSGQYRGGILNLTTYRFQNECAASANAAQLATVTVSDEEAVTLDSTTHIVGGDTSKDSSLPVTLRAQVAAQYATPAELSQGSVVFRNADTGEALGTPATPDSNGFAEISHQFDRIPDDDPEVDLNIVAEYTGVEGNIGPSSDSMTLTLTPKPVVQWVTDFTARATFGALTDDALPVTINATFQRPGLEYPEGILVTLYRNGEAVGNPVAMPTSGTSLTWQDDVERTSRNATYRYTVELETTRVGYNQWSGATAQPAAVIVRGLGGATTEPGTGGDDGNDELQDELSDLIGYDVAPLSAALPGMAGSLGAGN